MTLALEDAGIITFELTQAQWRLFNSLCPDWLTDAIDDTSKEFSSSVYRLGLSVYRLAMILSVLALYDGKALTTNIVCSDLAFSTAMEMAKVLLEHSKLMYASMPKHGKHEVGLTKQDQFLLKLPPIFDRAMADVVAKDITISERSVTNYLQRLVAHGLIKKINHGHYQKA